jgi:prevent-host-death family protein
MSVATKVVKKAIRKTAVRYIVNAKGKKTGVVLPISMYERMLERLEDIEDRQDIDEAMRHPDFIPWEEAERQLDALANSD